MMPKRASFALLLFAAAASGQKFYPDDPLQREPAPVRVEKVAFREVEGVYDFFFNTFWKPGDRRRIPAEAVNTLGDPMDGAWYNRRHFWRRMSLEELALGPGGRTPPADGPWTVVRAKTEGVTPGFIVVDSNQRTYHLKFDPVTNPEMATAAEVISARFFYALGYHVADQYIVYFSPDRLVLGEKVKVADWRGRKRKMTSRDLTEILMKTRRGRDGRYRAVASRGLPGEVVGKFRFLGTRADDPNDVVPHENRRDLRALRVFCAWLAHDDSRAVNTLDTLVEENGWKYIRHHLLDFGSALGSASTKANPPRGGHEYLFAWNNAAKHFFSLGFYVPHWLRASYPDYPSVGRIEAEAFNPVTWVPEYPNPAFHNSLPDDEYWAAKQVQAFTDDEIRAVVKTGQFSDPKAEDYLARTLMQRRDKIGRALLEAVLPLDRFEIREGRLAFEDLGLKHGTAKTRELRVSWRRLGEDTAPPSTDGPESSFALPAGGDGYWVASIVPLDQPRKIVRVTVRRKGSEAQIVGLERRW